MDSNHLSALPRLRPGLRFTPVHDANQSHYILEDTARNVYYRVGPEEYLLLANLNQSASFEDLLTRTAADTDIELTAEHAQTILSWLAGKELLQTNNPENLTNLLNREKQIQDMRKFNRMNLISFKIPLFNPDSFLRKTSPWLHWLTGPFFALFWLFAGFLALSTLISHWQEFTGQTTGFFSPMNLLLLWMIWLGLKVVHELFHALVCYRYGGKVFEAGLLFILFIPLTYVNATASWKFPSRWQRIHVAVAGMFIELGIAWLALLMWQRDPDSTTGMIAHRTVIIAGISSLLFNANPLMRFDGYYILSDLTGIPNLYQLGLQSVKDQFARLLLNIQPNANGDRNRLFIHSYGFLCMCWRILILGSLGYLASKLFGGLGIIISLAAALIWIASPIYAFITRWPSHKQRNQHVVRDLLLRGALMLCLLTVLFSTIGWKQTIRAPAVVEYEQQHRVKTGTSGFVSQILVENGAMVVPDQPLMILEDTDLVAALHDTELLLAQNEIHSRMAHNASRFAEVQILRQQRQALMKRLQQQQEQVDSLTIKAPAGGRVLADKLAERSGSFLDQGFEILWIVHPEQKHLTASISQDDIDQLRNLVGKPVTIDMRNNGLGRFNGIVKRISPSASTTMTDPAFAARYGGPIDVLERRVKNRNNTNREQIQLEFFKPRFSMEIEIPEKLVHRLWAGQLTFLQAEGARVSLRAWIIELFDNWLRKKDSIAGQ